MDPIYKIKRSCYKFSELTPGCLFAWNTKSPFIRIYLGTNPLGVHMCRVVRSYGRDVRFPVESISYFNFNSAHIVVHRGTE